MSRFCLAFLAAALTACQPSGQSDSVNQNFDEAQLAPSSEEIAILLPLSPGEREALEGKRVRIEQTLTVTAVRDVSSGQITVSARGILMAPTEISPPGEGSDNVQSQNQRWSLPLHIESLGKLEPYTEIHVGSVFNALSGVMKQDDQQLRLVVEGYPEFVSNLSPQLSPPATGVIRIASYNLHEYFNGDGKGGGFPGERGAETQAHFQQQAIRIVAAIEEISPDVIGVMEIENDGFGPDSASASLNRAVSNVLNSEFAMATPHADRVGTDVISVGLLYRSDKLEALGPAVLLESKSFGSLNRVPIAQVLLDRVSGERFVVVVNHLKSKGYCPESGVNLDQGDGQACWNMARKEGSLEIVKWAKALAAENSTSNVLLVGDFNAYRQEDPVRAIQEAGLVELVAHHNQGIPQYSYIYRGAAGTLDYAFASESLASLSAGAFIWHINAAYPYSSRPSLPWLRSSDHDPVVVDLLFSQSDTSD